MAARQETGEDNTQQEPEVFVIPSVVCVAGAASGGRIVHVGPAVGWAEPNGIMAWEHEVTVVARADVPEELCRDLKLILPELRIMAIRYPHVHKAAKSSPLFAVSPEVAGELAERGVRTFTVGFDRISGGFFFFAEGGGKEPISLQGDLFEAIAPALEGGDSGSEIEACLDGLVDRILVEKSEGKLTEMSVELAAVLPRLAPAGAEMAALDELEQRLVSIDKTVEKFEGMAKELVAALDKAPADDSHVAIPLFEKAARDRQPPLALEFKSGGAAKFLQLPARTRWIAVGPFRPEGPDQTVVAANAEDQAAAAKRRKAAEEAKAAAAKRAAERKAAAEKAAAEKAAAEKAAAEKAAAEKAAAEKAAAEKAAAEAKKAAEQKAAAEARRKAEAKKKADEQAAAEKAEAKKKAEQAAAEKAEAKKKAEQAAAEKAAEAKKKADEQAAAEKAAAEKSAAQAKKKAEAAEKAVAEKAATEAKKKAAPAEKTAAEAKKKSDESKAAKAKDVQVITDQPSAVSKPESKSSTYVAILVVAVIVLVAVWALFLRG